MDGTMWLGAPGPTSTMRYQDAQYWNNHTVAGDGGIATFAAATFCNIAFPANLVLGGLDFGSGYQGAESAAFNGSDVTMTGNAFVKVKDTGTGIRLNVALKGTSNDTLAKQGMGRLRLLKNLQGFDRITVADGVLEQTEAVNGYAFGDSAGTSFELAGGEARYAPDTSGTSVRLPGSLDVTSGTSLLPLRNGVTMTANALNVATGGTLIVTAEGGMANLGTTEKLKFDTAPTLVNGIVDPHVVTRDPTINGGFFTFLSYDAEKGLVPYPETSLVDLASAGATDVAVATPAASEGEVAVADDTHVAALVVDNRASLKIAAGKTLTVGDGVHPAGVIFREQTDSTGYRYSPFSFDGTLDFGTSPGVVWKGSPGNGGSNGRGLEIKGRIAGSAGVTFAARPLDGVGGSGTFYRFANNCAAGWTGPTRFYNCRAWLYGPLTLPAGGDVYGSGTGQGASIWLESSGNPTYDQHFHVAGTRGVDGFPGFVTIGNATISGSVTIEDETYLNVQNVLTLSCPLRGAGDLTVKDHNGTAGILVLDGDTSDYSGRLTVNHANLKVKLGPTALLPTNVVTISKGMVQLADRRDLTLATPLKGTTAGTLRLDQCAVTLQGPQNFPGALALDVATDSNTCSTVELRGRVKVGRLTGENGAGTGVIRAATAETELVVGDDGAASLVKPRLTNGSAPLAFTKEGSNTVTLLGLNTYTGRTTVRGGTLRLRGKILESPSISWWVDASKPETILCDGNGEITNWVSRVNGVSFVRASTQGPVRATAANGLGVVNFVPDYPCGLYTPANVTVRTVFVVYRWGGKTDGVDFHCLFGRKGSDCGLRTGSTGLFERNISTSKFNTLGYVYHNGEKKTSNFAALSDSFGVVTIQHDHDWVKGDSAVAGSVPSTFLAELGGYNNNAGCRWVGDIAEAIAFDRLLSDGERQEVENYLAAKWRGAAVNANVPQETSLSAQTDVTVEYGATLDLAGETATVASLAGTGTIRNSSTNAATLTVSGACSFAGRIEGDVKLVAAGGANTLALDLRGASSLALNGGTTALAAYTNAPPTEHLAYWLDATDESTVACNANGYVTNWASRAGVVSAFSWGSSGVTGVHAGTTGPGRYTTAADGLNGLRAVYFTTNGQELIAREVAIARTLFLVLENDAATQKGNGGYWGKNNIDRGIRIAADTTLENMVRVTYYLKGDLVRYNGTTWNMASTRPKPKTSPFCFVVRLDDAMHPADECQYGGTKKIFTYRDQLGCYGGTGNGNPNFRVGEVIAYTNALSDAEVLSVESYLMNKWALGGRSTEAAPSTAFNGTGALELSGGATLAGDLDLGDGKIVVKVNGAGEVETVTVNGNLTLGPGARIEVDDYRATGKNTIYTVVDVTGSVTGAFASTNVTQAPWKLVRSGTSWKLISANGTTVIFR